ncbi:DsbC family protein [Moraxella marmotae]|uniref:DsbC family protein n=1 Tax=Moraxella marmotae TaxID=3344520 RepID=UPI0035F35B99
MKSIFSHLPLSAAIIGTLLITACNQPTNAKAPTDSQAHTVSSQTTSSQAASISDDTVVKALQDNLKKSGADITVTAAIATAMPDIYWVSFDDAPAMFTNKAGTHLIQGQIVELGGERPVDIAADIQAKLAKDALSQVPSDEMIIYPAKGKTQAAIYVFSDPTCQYCQKLHHEIDSITKAGIEVRYLAWPRSPSDVPLAEAIWCSADRHAALTAAKNGKSVQAAPCDNPVLRHITLGRSLGVSGTPAIFSESGRQIGGYIPAKELAELAKKYR